MNSQHMPLVSLGGSGATFPRIALVFWYRKPVLQHSCSEVAVYCRVLQSVSHVSTHHSCFWYQKYVLQRSCSVIQSVARCVAEC